MEGLIQDYYNRKYYGLGSYVHIKSECRDLTPSVTVSEVVLCEAEPSGMALAPLLKRPE